MTRKVLVRYKGREYRVDSDDIEQIVRSEGLDGKLDSEEKRMAELGLMYLESVS